jgi:hypothetical protein
MLAGIALSRRRALRLLHHHALKQRADLTLCLASLGRRRLRKPSEQSHRHGYVLACPSEAWEPIIILDDSLMCITGTSAHLVTVLCDLVFERRVLLFQVESRSFELSLSLPQLVHTWVGRDFCV